MRYGLSDYEWTAIKRGEARPPIRVVASVVKILLTDVRDVYQR